MTKTQLNAGDTTHISGIKLSALASGIRHKDRLDLVLIEVPEEATSLVYLPKMRSVPLRLRSRASTLPLPMPAIFSSIRAMLMPVPVRRVKKWLCSVVNG